MAEPFLGQIMAVGYNFAPRGWAICDGSLLQIAPNTALFSLLGTMYGGNGQTTFALPDLRGRVIVGTGNGPGLSPYVQGQNAGVENVNLLVSNMPAHTHIATVTMRNGSSPTTGATNVAAANVPATLVNPVGAIPAIPNFGRVQIPAYAPAGSATGNLGGVTTAVSDGSVGEIAVSNSLTGSNIPFSIVQPYTSLLYVIALEGIFPSRN